VAISTATRPVAVIGAGTMGSGIAQVFAAAGRQVYLGDRDPASLERGLATIAKSLDRLIKKGTMDAAARAQVLGRIRGAVQGLPLSECGLAVEAVPERLDLKRAVLQELDRALPPDSILATNTSSISITELAAATSRPSRVIGMHFMNPVPVMPLVEVVRGQATSRALVDAAGALVQRWGKTAVIAADTPGFIVNRVARPFYGEALRILDEGIADCATIDWAMRTLGAFKMGPFELMDLIGNDVSFAVTSAVYEGFFFDPRYKPSLTQRRLVDANLLGRKTGRGYYDYRDGAVRPAAREDEALGRSILHRILAMLLNEAVDAVFWGVATPADLDVAMVKGVNYPRGLIEWAEEVGYRVVLERLEGLQAEYGEDRYRPSPLLRRLAASGGTLRA